MRWFLSFLALAFIVAFVAVVGVRASGQGEAFVLGVACGAAASLPASLLAFYLTQRTEAPQQPQQATRPAYPPVLVVNGPAAPRSPLPDFPPLTRPQTSPPRYGVVGE